MVKTGYKHTEIGIIPQSWDVSILGHHATICRGGSPRPIQAYLTQAASGLNWIKIGDVRPDDKYITATRERIIPEGLSKTREVAEGDFLLSNSMSFGRPYILKIKGCIHDGWLTVQNYKHTFDTDFLYYYLSSDAVLWQYISMAAGSGVQNLNKEKVAAVTLAIPPIGEQKRIATVLSDIDALIANLEKLIAKKKAIKQGAMQELLSGKRRLPGFSGDWTECVLTDVADLITDTIPVSDIDPRYYVGTDNMVSNRGGVKQNRIELQYSAVRHYMINDILLSNIRPYLKKIWYADTNGGCSSDVLVIRTKNDGKILAGFLYQLLSQDVFFEEVTANAVGTKMPRGDKNVIKAYPLCMPVDLQEQREILKILSEMQVEIENLEKNLNKYKQIKQGMMGELLTGRIRLIDKEDA